MPEVNQFSFAHTRSSSVDRVKSEAESSPSPSQNDRVADDGGTTEILHSRRTTDTFVIYKWSQTLYSFYTPMTTGTNILFRRCKSLEYLTFFHILLTVLRNSREQRSLKP